MKTEAPDKIYLIRNIPTSTSLNTTNDCREKYLQEWYQGREKDADVEYVRTDAFIERACDWLHLQLNKINMKGEDMGNFLNDFKNYMKGK